MANEQRSNIIKNILFLIAAVAITAMAMEIALRLFYPLYSDYNTEMWRYSSDMKKLSENRLLSHEHMPNKSGFYYGAEIKTNADGFRDYNYRAEKGSDAYRILMLGDSITLGWGVNFSDTFPKMMEKRLNNLSPGKKFEVINTGVGNYNTQMEVELLKAKGLKYKPDLIILNYYINDAELTKKPNFFAYPLKSGSYLYAFLWDKISNLILRLSRDNYLVFYSRLYEDSFEGKKIMLQSINELSSISKERNIKLLIVAYPEFHNFKNYSFGYVTDTIKNASLSNRVPFLDLLPYYANTSPESVWVSYEDAHPNALGNSIAANAVTDFLIKKNLVPS